MEIKTKPATAAYVENFTKIFNKSKPPPMKRYRVPVDIFIDAKSIEDVKEQLEWELRDLVYELPVCYPIDEDILT